jgi:preprotein translocase subunit YajC
LSSLHILSGTGHALLLAATTTTAKHTTSSAISYLPLILLIAVGGYLLFIRPRNQAMRRQQQQGRELAVGDRVLTRAGIVGRVRGFSGDRVQLEIADGVVIEVVRQGIGQQLPDQLDDEDLIPPPPGADEADEDAEDEGATADWGHADAAEDWQTDEHDEHETEDHSAGSPAEPVAGHDDPFDVSAEDPLATPPGDGAAADGAAVDGGRRKGRRAKQ